MDSFLGLDLSTQGLKAVVVDSGFHTQFECSVNFDSAFPEYGTDGGVLVNGSEVTAPSVMFIKALDSIMEKLSASQLDLSSIRAVSGSGQQHGSVWLNETAEHTLANLDSSRLLSDQCLNIFSMENGPVWMDSSTGCFCRELENAVGGAGRLAEITGSRAFERFTGNQIAKIFYKKRDVYEKTARIALISSFISTLLIGRFSAIDMSDGSGMNLLNITTGEWDEAALMYAGGQTLKSKLGTPKPSYDLAGYISPYFVDRYGFSEDCRVILFSGDNPNSLAGLSVAGSDDVIISMGTSDTIFGATPKAVPSAESGHVFISPMDPESYMVMLVRQNGSLTREKVRDEYALGSWKTFADMLAYTPVGNGGKTGFYIYTTEITPTIKNTGVFRFDENCKSVEWFRPEEEVRAVCESQFMSLRLHSEKFGLNPKMIIATGGASVDRSLTQIISDIFGRPVAVASTPDSAAMGAAYRAMHGYICAEKGCYVEYNDITANAVQPLIVSKPNMNNHLVYSKLMPRFEQLENTLS